MKPNTQTINYPFLSMNHLAMMLVMIKHRLFFTKQAEAVLGYPIKIMPPQVCPDNNTPLCALITGKGAVTAFKL